MRKLILATMVLMLLSSVGYGADWKSLGKDTDNNEWFYDTQSISREQDTVTVWTKTVLSDKEKADFIRKFQYGKSPSLSVDRSSEGEATDIDKRKKRAELLQEDRESKENLSYRIDKNEIDCVKNRIKVISSAWFNSIEDLIHIEKPPNPLFKDIAPNSIMAKLAETICKKGEGGK